MMYYLEYYLYFLSGFYFYVYVFAAIILLIGTRFFKSKYKWESYNLLYVFNTAAAWASFVILLYFIIDLFVAWYGQSAYEYYAFQSGKHGTLFALEWLIIKILIPFLVGLFFFIKKLRINRLFTILLIILLNSELIVKLFYRFFSKDYLPSSWAATEESFVEKSVKYIVVFLLLLLLYVIAKKKNELPYPSVFLK